MDHANNPQALDALRPFGRLLNLALAEYGEVMNLLLPGVSFREIIVQAISDDLGAALEQFVTIAEDLKM